MQTYKLYYKNVKSSIPNYKLQITKSHVRAPLGTLNSDSEL